MLFGLLKPEAKLSSEAKAFEIFGSTVTDFGLFSLKTFALVIVSLAFNEAKDDKVASSLS